MIKNILVALDPDEDTSVATRYAAELARRFDAVVSGLAIIDTKKIAAEVGPGGAVGALYYADVTRQRKTDEARDTARGLLQAFDALLDEAAVRHGERVEEGVPVKEVIKAMKYHDLLVIGSTSHFYYTHPEQKTNTLSKIVKKAVAPTLVVDAIYREIKQILVAYDGSDASARTLQRFAQLQPFGTDVAVELVHVRKSDNKQDRAASALLLSRGGAFLRDHGFAQVVETSRNGGKPDHRLLEHVRHIEADLVVAGAHSVSAMRRLAFGSTTHTLLSECPVPFFLFH